MENPVLIKSSTMDQSSVNHFRRRKAFKMTPDERLERFLALQKQSMDMMSEQALAHFHRRNHKKRRVSYQDGKWTYDRTVSASKGL